MIISIGLDQEMVARIKAAIGKHVLGYETVPNMYSKDGKLYVESKQVMGKFLEPEAVIYYGYFPGIDTVSAMKTIALSNVRSFPDVRSTVFHEDRALSLVLAGRADITDPKLQLERGWIPGNVVEEVVLEAGTVIKSGNEHCGENKERLLTTTKPGPSRDGILVEPFVEGQSRRILVVAGKTWQIDYESEDWRKNVNATIKVTTDADDPWLVTRTLSMTRSLGLSVLGADFIGERGNWKLLEVNAYPGLEDIPEAQNAFVELVCQL